MLYTNGKIQDIIKIPLVVPPNAGAWYKGIQHKALYELITQAVKDAGYYVGAVTVAASRNGVEFAGALQLEHDEPLPHDVPKPWLAWTTANDRKSRLRFYIGGTTYYGSKEVSVSFLFRELCKNNLDKTHTINTDLPMRINAAMIEFTAAEKHLATYAAMARELKLTTGQYTTLLVEAGRGGPKKRALPWSYFGHFDTAYLGTHGSMMAFLACHTKVIKDTAMSPLSQIPAMLRMRAIIRENGLLKPAKVS